MNQLENIRSNKIGRDYLRPILFIGCKIIWMNILMNYFRDAKISFKIPIDLLLELYCKYNKCIIYDENNKYYLLQRTLFSQCDIEDITLFIDDDNITIENLNILIQRESFFNRGGAGPLYNLLMKSLDISLPEDFNVILFRSNNFIFNLKFRKFLVKQVPSIISILINMDLDEQYRNGVNSVQYLIDYNILDDKLMMCLNRSSIYCTDDNVLIWYQFDDNNQEIDFIVSLEKEDIQPFSNSIYKSIFSGIYISLDDLMSNVIIFQSSYIKNLVINFSRLSFTSKNEHDLIINFLTKLYDDLNETHMKKFFLYNSFDFLCSLDEYSNDSTDENLKKFTILLNFNPLQKKNYKEISQMENIIKRRWKVRFCNDVAEKYRKECGCSYFHDRYMYNLCFLKNILKVDNLDIFLDE